MKLTVENYRGIRRADIELAPLALVCAPNESGKSSIAQAVGAVLCGQPIPLPGVLKSMAGMLVRQGAAKGSVTLESAGGTATVEWPRATLKTTGTPPTVSPVAAGLSSLADMQPVDRGRFLIELLHALPGRDDLARRLEPEGVTAETVDHVWKTIETQGWDAAHAQFKEQGARQKGAWEATTGDRFGTKKAESWLPKNWDADLHGTSEETLQAILTDARDTLNAMIGVAAVDDAERDRLSQLADGLKSAVERKAACESDAAAADVDHKRAQQILAALRKPSAQEETQQCPHCANPVVVRGGKVFAPAGNPVLSDEESLQYQKGIENERAAAERLRQARGDLQSAELDVRKAEDAAKQLSGMRESTHTSAQLDRAREFAASAERRLSAWQQKRRADVAFRSVLETAAIVTALAPDGLRQEVLARTAQQFMREWVRPLADAAGWSPVEIDGDMLLTYGDRAFVLLSESQKFRVRVLLQVAIALRERAAAVVIDAADILDKGGRNGLFRLLAMSKLPALVCMTLDDANNLPDLCALGLGRSYWIERGETRTVEKEMAAAS